MPGWLESGTAIAGIVSGVLAFLGLAGLYFAAHPHIEKRLTNNAEYRTRRAEQLREVAYGDLYLRSLHRALAWLKEVMGPPWHPRALGISITIAFSYTILFFWVSWIALGAQAGLAEAAFLPDTPGWIRGITAFGALLYICVQVFVLRHEAHRIAFGVLTAGGVAGFAVSWTGAFAVFIAMMIVFGLAEGFAVSSRGLGAWLALALVAAIAGVLVIGISMLGMIDINDPDEAAFLLFWAALPVANAAWDWASWWVSRWLGADLARRIRSRTQSEIGNAWAGLWHGALDLGAALVLLMALALTLPNIVEWFLPVFADEQQWCRMAREPFGEGLWVTSMLLSTLFPTALHLMAVIASPAAALALRFRQSPEVADVLERANAMGNGSAYEIYLQGPRFKQAVDQAAFYFGLVRPAIWTAAAIFACIGLWGLIELIWLGLDGLLFFLPRIDTLPEFLLGVAYDLDFEKAAACFDGVRPSPRPSP